jgi:hypothetical protein
MFFKLFFSIFDKNQFSSSCIYTVCHGISLTIQGFLLANASIIMFGAHSLSHIVINTSLAQRAAYTLSFASKKIIFFSCSLINSFIFISSQSCCPKSDHWIINLLFQNLLLLFVCSKKAFIISGTFFLLTKRHITENTNVSSGICNVFL